MAVNLAYYERLAFLLRGSLESLYFRHVFLHFCRKCTKQGTING